MTLPAARAECTSSYNWSGRIAISARDHRIVRRRGSAPHSRCSLGWVLERGGVRAARLVQGLRLVLIRVARGLDRPLGVGRQLADDRDEAPTLSPMLVGV